MTSVVQGNVRSRISTICTALCIGLVIALLSTGLIACSSHLGNQSSSTSTASEPVTPSTQVQHCGKVQTVPQGALLDASAAKQATNCFWHAFQHCHAALLIFTSGGVDTATIRTFTVEDKSGQCSISDTVQDVMGPNPASAAKNYTCTGLAQQSDGLHFASCGEDGDVFVPSVAVR